MTAKGDRHWPIALFGVLIFSGYSTIKALILLRSPGAMLEFVLVPHFDLKLNGLVNGHSPIAGLAS